MKMKYIIVEIDGKLVPVMFGEAISHKAMFRGLQIGVREDQRDSGRGFNDVDLNGAGFVEGLTATNVYGESESLRYGFDSIPRDLWHLTTSKPEDLTVINDGKVPEEVRAAKAEAAANLQEAVKEYVAQILLKKAPEARHKSPAGRHDAAIAYVTKHLKLEGQAARSLVNDVAVSRAPNAYKIA